MMSRDDFIWREVISGSLNLVAETTTTACRWMFDKLRLVGIWVIDSGTSFSIRLL
jgi:hypothetical protein